MVGEEEGDRDSASYAAYSGQTNSGLWVDIRRDWTE